MGAAWARPMGPWGPMGPALGDLVPLEKELFIVKAAAAAADPPESDPIRSDPIRSKIALKSIFNRVSLNLGPGFGFPSKFCVRGWFRIEFSMIFSKNRFFFGFFEF